jgi:uracil-DNA glycosylase
MREGRTAEYWKFIERLSVEYSIYITDIYKVFFYGGPQKAARSYKNTQFVRNTLHQDILNKEIEIISPNVIITMGDLATQMVLNDKNKRFKPISRFNVAENTLSLNNTDLIPMVHLSGSSRGGQKIFLATNNRKPQPGSTNGDLYFEIIKSFLDKQQHLNAF